MTTRRLALPLAALLALALPALARGQAKYSIKTSEAAPPKALSAEMSKLFSSQCVQLQDAKGDTILEVWFRKEVPAKATEAQVKNGLTYKEVPISTVLAAIRVPKTFTDYRKQEIAAGTYTLRFGVQPDVGDHMGTTPHPEFALLSPAAKDKDAEAIEMRTLIKLSSGATNGDHPGVMLLFPHAAKDDGPTIADKEDGVGVKVLLVRRAIDADGVKTKLGFALTVAGYSKARK